MLETLKEEVCAANKQLPAHALALFTWGNVSAIDRKSALVVIKPSGVPYEDLKPSSMVVTDLDGAVVEGKLRPSSDLETHLVLYKASEFIGGLVHTHSTFATAFAQAGRGIPPLGTTHADYFYGEVPCTRRLRKTEINGLQSEKSYEKATGEVIVETFKKRGLDFAQIPAALTAGHGPFCWGKNADEAVHNAVVLEETAKMAFLTFLIHGNYLQGLLPAGLRLPQALLDKHYLRKHGKNAYYGQG